MDNKVQISSQVIVCPKQPPRIIMGSANSFQRKLVPSDTYTRPLMINAWSQTTGDDFRYLQDLTHKAEQTQREKELVQKVQLLEENLRVQTELLSQIHATSAITSALLGHTSQSATTAQLSKPIQIQSVESQSSLQIPCKSHSPKKIVHTSPTSSVMNPLHSLATTATESVKYTIIAEGSGDVNGEPIEIQLAEDDGALNLNSSADSGRLEICLEDNVEIKTESEEVTSQYSTSSPSEQNFIKRRKLDVYQNDVLAEKPNFYLNGQGQFKSAVDIDSTPNCTPAQKRRNVNSLLKTCKTGNKISPANTQTMPTQSIKPSPSNIVSSLNGISPYGGAPGEMRVDTDNVMVSIGPNNTRIPAKHYESISWNSASIATRKLLMAVFDRKTLATHSMTGKPSPAFKDHGKPLKQMLDPVAIQDIIFAVSRKCNVSEKEVRNAITTKCADENKMMKLQMNKLRTPMREINKENIAVGGRHFKSEL